MRVVHDYIFAELFRGSWLSFISNADYCALRKSSKHNNKTCVLFTITNSKEIPTSFYLTVIEKYYIRRGFYLTTIIIWLLQRTCKTHSFYPIMVCSNFQSQILTKNYRYTYWDIICRKTSFGRPKRSFSLN